MWNYRNNFEWEKFAGSILLWFEVTNAHVIMRKVLESFEMESMRICMKHKGHMQNRNNPIKSSLDKNEITCAVFWR